MSAFSSTSMFIIKIHSVSRQAHSRISSYIVSKSQVQQWPHTISEIDTSTFVFKFGPPFSHNPFKNNIWRTENDWEHIPVSLIIWKSSLTYLKTSGFAVDTAMIRVQNSTDIASPNPSVQSGSERSGVRSWCSKRIALTTPGPRSAIHIVRQNVRWLSIGVRIGCSFLTVFVCRFV